MAKIIGLTGGIGSGKSTVAKEFSTLGVPCYIADQAAKKLMTQDKFLKQKIITLFGEEAYLEGQLNRTRIGQIVFNAPEKLKVLNSLVHPAVAKDFKQWLVKQNHPYVIKEVAILFETGGHEMVDKTLLITAPKELRISRVIDRDNTTREAVLSRIASQWEDDKRRPLADYIIENKTWSVTQKATHALHKEFLTL